MHFSLKDSFVYFDIIDNINALLPKPLYEVCLMHFTTPPTHFVCVDAIYVNVLFVVI